MTQPMPPKDFFVTAVQYTRRTFRDIHPTIDPKNPSNSLAGKIAIITGASRGIGARGIAPVFASAGIHGLVLVARDEGKLINTKSEIEKINPTVDVWTVALDITDAAEVESLFVKIQDRYNRHADILVNNAGVSVAGNKGGPVLHEAPVDTWWYNFEVNVKAYFLLSKYFISSLPSPTTPVTIINITSGAAWLLHPTVAGYSVSKLASIQWSAHLDAAYNGSLTVVNVHPGIVETDMLSEGFRYFDKDSPLLSGGVCAWIAANPERSRFLSGRSISANWDIDELLARASDIKLSKDLKIDILGRIGGYNFA